MAADEYDPRANHLLASLAPGLLERLLPSLRPVELALRKTVQTPGYPVEEVLLPLEGYLSVLAPFEDGETVEVGMIGREGLSGLPLILAADHPMTETIVQGGGRGLRMDADAFTRAMDDHAAWRTLMLRYAMWFNMQVTMTAACNGRHLIEQRLARWLMMAHDRSTGERFPMTHEFLSMMLGVRRAGVTVAAGTLQRAGYISYDQGVVTVLDRAGLETAACECHGVVRRQYRRLVGRDPGRGAAAT